MKIRIFAILALCMFSSMLGVGIIAPLVPLYAEKMGANGLWIGIIFASFSISQAALMPFFGEMSDRRGKKVLLCTGLFFYSIISMGYLYAGEVYQLTIVRLIHGAAGGMLLPMGQAYIGDLSPEGKEGRWMGYYNASIFTGFGAGPILGGVLSQVYNVEMTFYAMGGLNFVAFLLCLFFLPEVRSAKPKKGGNGKSLKILMASPMLRGLASFQLSFAMGRGMFITFLPVFAVSVAGLTTGQVGAIIGANILLMSFLQLFAGRLVDVWDRKRLVIIGGALCFLPLAAMPVLASFWYIMVLAVLAGVGGAFAIPAASALAVTEGRSYGMGATLGAFNMAMSLGFAIGPILGGVAMDTFNVNGIFYLATLTGLLGVSFFARLMKFS